MDGKETNSELIETLKGMRIISNKYIPSHIVIMENKADIAILNLENMSVTVSKKPIPERAGMW